MADAPVVIAGAGPVGLTLAWALATRDVPVVVCEQGDGPSTASRASTFHPSTLDLLDDLGVADHLLARGLRADTFQYRDRREGVVAAFDLGVLAGDVRHPYRVQLEQSELCRSLADRLHAMPECELRFAHEVHDVGDHQLLTGAGSVPFRWLVGADGASSAVRKATGVGFDGFTFDERFLVVSTELELRDHIPGLALVSYVSDPEEWLVLLRTPRHWRILFPIAPDEDDEVAGSADRIAERVAGVVPGLDIPVAHTTAYRIHQRVASTFRCGDVLLAGDAAHLNNPLGGMGMNSGLHDAVALGRRLADAWHGRRDADEALDEYACLRREVAVDIVDAQTRRNFATLANPDPAGRRAALDDLARTAEDPELARAYLLRTTLVSTMRTHT
jgi:2-polyprenyl-6-methoxyphenol hydroxylase-like FAD-dependent oxidoreductase